MLLECSEIPVPSRLLHYRYARAGTWTRRSIGFLRFAVNCDPSTGRLEFPDIGDAGLFNKLIRSKHKILAGARPRVDLSALGARLSGDSVSHLYTDVDFDSMTQNTIPDR